jgi:hypothetical protein
MVIQTQRLINNPPPPTIGMFLNGDPISTIVRRENENFLRMNLNDEQTLVANAATLIDARTEAPSKLY